MSSGTPDFAEAAKVNLWSIEVKALRRSGSNARNKVLSWSGPTSTTLLGNSIGDPAWSAPRCHSLGVRDDVGASYFSWRRRSRARCKLNP